MRSFLFFIDSKLPYERVAIGKFDGMHKAHLKLLEELEVSKDSKDIYQNKSLDSKNLTKNKNLDSKDCIQNENIDSKISSQNKSLDSKKCNQNDNLDSKVFTQNDNIKSSQNKNLDFKDSKNFIESNMRSQAKIVDFARINKACALSIASVKPPFVTPPNERQKYAKVPFYRLKFELIKGWDSLKFLRLLFEIMPNLQEIIVGYDFCFGANRASNVLDLRDMLDSINRNYVKVKVIESITYNGTPIHTSIIKELLKYGDMDSANAMLGRFYSIKGRVIRGQGIGKKSLYATLNIKNSLNIIPKFGVYASFIKIYDENSKNANFLQNRFYKAVTFIGRRLSTDKLFSIETHIIESIESSKNNNFNTQKVMQNCLESSLDSKIPQDYLESILQNLTHIRIFFVKMLRNNKKFSDLNTLKKQISKDIESAKDVLDSTNFTFCK